MDLCDKCGGRFDRPGRFRCEDLRHAKPDLAQRIVADIECDLTGRRGFKFTGIADETQDAMRDKWADIIRRHVNEDW